MNEDSYVRPYEAHIQKGGKEYVAFRTYGGSTQVRATCSDISLRTLEGIGSVVMQHIHSNFETIRRAVPRNECLVSPVVRLHIEELGHQRNLEQYKYMVTIPHNLPPDCDVSTVKVRYGNIEQPRLLKELGQNKPLGTAEPYFEVKSDVIEIHSNHFCDIISSCDGTICKSKVIAMQFGSICKEKDSTEVRTYVKIKTYLCNYLYSSETYKSVCVHNSIYFLYLLL